MRFWRCRGAKNILCPKLPWSLFGRMQQVITPSPQNYPEWSKYSSGVGFAVLSREFPVL